MVIKDWFNKTFSTRNYDNAVNDVTNFFDSLFSSFKSLFGSSPKTQAQPIATPQFSNYQSTTGWQETGFMRGVKYGGDGSGSFMDYLHKFVYLTDQLNPIALVWDGISGYAIGEDRFGNALSGTESSIKIVSAIPVVEAEMLAANAISKVTTKISSSIASTSINAVGKTGSSWLQGGKTFAQYKAARGGTETLAKISTSTGTQRISTEFHHVFLTQRMQRAHNFPNWAVNNRLNVWKLNTVQHSLIDSHRYNFLRADFKPDIGWFGKYNLFTKF